MMETTMISHGLPFIPARRTRARRESKVAYRNTPAQTTRNGVGGTATYAASPEEVFARSNDRFQLQSSPIQGFNANGGFTDYINVPADSGNSVFKPVLNQNHNYNQNQSFQDEDVWYAPTNLYTLDTNPPIPSQYSHANNAQSPRSAISQVSTEGHDMSWTSVNRPNTQGPDLMLDMGMAGMEFGSYGSLGSMENILQPTPSTAASDFSDGYQFPPATGTNSFQVQQETPDLSLNNNWYTTGNSASPASPDSFQFDNNEFGNAPASFTYVDVYSTDAVSWPSPTVTTQQSHVETANLFAPAPWDSQNAQISNFQYNADAGGVAFEPKRENGYGIHVARQQYLDNSQQTNHMFSPDPVSPCNKSETEGWVVASYAPSSYAASHGSPLSHASPASHPPSPPQHEMVHHSHIFDSLPGIPKVKLTRGRQRGLTALEKKQARDVRDAKACWACHISKTKCSPCSPGKPCEQCARLAGKRRFCLFSCFNDPLETLSTFMVPDYLMGHFTRTNVENFVTRNASTWGTETFNVQMTWGYRKHLQAEVVALALRSGSTDMAFQHQTISQGGDAKPILVRKESPPIGIPLAAMDDMQNVYSNYIQNIVQSDLVEYVPVAYTDQNYDMPEDLLGAVCNYYSAGLAVDNESEILRRAIELHVTAVILERSLILDELSLRKVSNHLGQEFPSKSAPRCAQRQIKLAFFVLQQRRIQRVLKDWGSMMWTTNSSLGKDKEWATAFCVFIMLILVMDKTLGAAYYFCEGRILHHGQDEDKERTEFERLVRLTQKELFERCKEIFHWKFKTRKGGKEACNPIRDGIDAFTGKTKGPLDGDVAALVEELQILTGGFLTEIRSHRASLNDTDSEFANAGRLACIFLDDFLGR